MELAAARHVVVTRFSVPRPGADTASRHADPAWLERRLELFDRFFAPSVGRLGVPVVLLCSTPSAPRVTQRLAAWSWLTVAVQDEWRGGWRGGPEQTVTRLDSDDALHGGWFEALDRAPAAARVCCTRSFYRLDLPSGRLYRYRRRELSPLAAFRGGVNPYAHDHRELARHYPIHIVTGGPYLLQVAHGGNVKTHRPAPWRLDRRVSSKLLEAFGLTGC